MNHSVQQLVDYLRIAAKLESKLFEAQQAYRILNNARGDLSVRYHEPPKYAPEEHAETSGMIGSCASIAFFIGGAVGTYIGWTSESNSPGSSIGDGVVFFINCIFFGVFVGAIGAAIGAIIGLLVKCSAEKKVTEKNRLNKEKVDKKVSERRQALYPVLETFDRELKSANEVIDTYRLMLTTHYVNGPIYRKYHTLSAVCQLLEYFEAGRFGNLGEAYNQYELEVRLDKIVTSVDSLGQMLESSLSRLENNQRELCDLLYSIKGDIESIKRDSKKCSDSLDQVTLSAAMQTYYLEKAAEAGSLLAEMEWYEKKYSLPASAQNIEASVKALRSKI